MDHKEKFTPTLELIKKVNKSILLTPVSNNHKRKTIDDSNENPTKRMKVFSYDEHQKSQKICNSSCNIQ